MNRRSILGAIVGAPLAAPQVAKNFAQGQFAQQVGYSGSAQSCIGAVGSINAPWMEPDDAIRKAFRLGLVTRAKVAEMLAQSGMTESVSACSLDADLLSAKSFSLAARIRMQRDRNADRSVDRFLDKPKSIWDHGRDLISKGLVSGDVA
jgi:hypothetical protein